MFRRLLQAALLQQLRNEFLNEAGNEANDKHCLPCHGGSCQTRNSDFDLWKYVRCEEEEENASRDDSDNKTKEAIGQIVCRVQVKGDGA